MPKQLFVDPKVVRRRGEVIFRNVPVHAYCTPLSQERGRLGDKQLVEVLRHMLIVREFERMLGAFKAQGNYAGTKFNYNGPAHLSIGQEAAAVGAAMALAPEDHVFGSHRSHGEFIAKGLSAIAKIGSAELMTIMERHKHGELLRAVKAHIGGKDEKSLAENFLLFGLLAEIFMSANGFNGGMGGSMHAFFPPFGAYPNNAIVGASAGIAVGSALFKKLSRNGGVAVANIGDGATGCGPVWEAMNFAAMAQYDQLWDAPFNGGLPILFFFCNNFYAMGGQTLGETSGWDRLSRIGAAVNPASMHAETVDGANALAVFDAVERKRLLLETGRGPALLDVECYRLVGHSPSDANAYRTRDELKAWDEHDPIKLYAAALLEEGVLDANAQAALHDEVTARIRAVAAAAVNPAAAPAVDIKSDPLLIGRLMFSRTQIDPPTKPTGLPGLLETSSRLQQLADKRRSGLGEDGQKVSPMRAITIRDSLFETILHHFAQDDRLIAYGEECREWGGAFGVYRGLAEVLPYHRLFNAPISEAAIVASAVGYAIEGGRALVELMYADFIGRAGDEIFNQMAKWRAMSGGLLEVPVVLRCSIGSKYGAQHSQDWTGLIAHIPGLKLLYPATPYDAKGLLASALSGNDPVVFFESQRLYDSVELFHEDGVPADYYQIPIGEPDLKRQGRDITILTIGPSLYPAIAAAQQLQTSFGISAEIIDVRSLVPFNYDLVLQSVKKTGHILLVSEACERGSFLMTLATNINRFAFGHLKAPPRVLGAPNWIVPGAELEASYFPQAADIVAVVRSELMLKQETNPLGLTDWDRPERGRLAL
jgi:2-oxoisovalerate dehydrogenase E1 component